MGCLADVLRAQRAFDKAEGVLGGAVSVATAAFGSHHLVTLVLEAKAGRIMLDRDGDSASLRDVVSRLSSTFGEQHPQTAKYRALCSNK